MALSTLGQDVRFALRGLRKSPGYDRGAVLGMVLKGASAACQLCARAPRLRRRSHARTSL